MSTKTGETLNVREIAAREVATKTFLAIDTALGTSVALGHAGTIFEITDQDPRGHTEAIGTLLERVLEMANVNPGEIDAVVQGVGPGPFTGLRVGIAAAQSFAFGISKPLLSVVSHDGVAIEQIGDNEIPVRVIQDAKRRELFVTEYSGLDESGIPITTLGPKIFAREGFDDNTNDFWPEVIPAARLIQLAARKLDSDQPFESGEALYLRQPDVNLMALQNQAGQA